MLVKRVNQIHLRVEISEEEKRMKEKQLDKTREERELHTEKDGWEYEGEWLKGKAVREGFGIFLNKGKDCIYEGYWKNSKRSCKGREIWLS